MKKKFKPRISVTVRNGATLTDQETKWLTDGLKDMIKFQLKNKRREFPDKIEFQYFI